MSTEIKFIDCQSLDEVRSNIDKIDCEIISLIAQRSHYVYQAPNFKKTVSEVTDTKRVETKIYNAKEIARQYKVSENIVEDTFRSMVNAFVKQEVCKFNPIYETLKKSYY